MKIVSCVVALAICTSLFAANLKPDGEHTTYYDDGTISQRWQRSNQKLNGPSQRWYRSGELQWQGLYRDDLLHGDGQLFAKSGQLLNKAEYEKGKREGKTLYYFRDESRKELISKIENYKADRLHGTSNQFYRDGSIQSSTPYHDGLRNGEAKQFRSNGAPYTTATFKSDLQEGTTTTFFIEGKKPFERSEFKSGKLHGALERYFDDGNLMQSSNYVAGKKEGEEKLFFAGGGLMQKTNYHAGLRHGLSTRYFRNAEVLSETSYAQGEIVGDHREFYHGGNLAAVTPYRNGLKHGTARIYHADGQKSMIPYLDGKRHGTAKRFFADGKLHIQELWHNDLPHGLYTEFDSNAILRKRENYKEGLRDGLALEFYPNGNLKQEDKYERGTIVYRRRYRNTGALELDHSFTPPTVSESAPSAMGVVNSMTLKTGKVLAPLSAVRLSPTTISAIYRGSRTIIQRHLIADLQTATGAKTSVETLPTKDGDRLIFFAANGIIAWSMTGYFDPSGSFLPKGLISHYHENGQLAQEYTIVDGFSHGPYRAWHPNGRLHLSCTFVRGATKALFNDAWNEYAPDGSLLQTMHYRRGVLSGEHRRFYRDGVMREQRHYVDGLLDGKRLRWHQNGAIAEISFWLLGKRSGVTQRFYDTGTVAEKSSWLAGRRHGSAMSWHPLTSNTQQVHLATTATYQNGLKQGMARSYFDNGKARSLQHFNNGALRGREVTWDRNGWVIKEHNWDK